MARVVSVWLPTWSTDRIRRHPGAPPVDQPLVLVGQDGRRRVLAAVDAAARQAGLRPGMPASDAQILVPGLTVQDHDAHADTEALDRLALWALRYAPIAAADPPDGLVVDSTGADHLHGGEAAMLADMVDRLAGAGIAARAAIADSWGAAYGLARWGARQHDNAGVTVSLAGAAAEAIATLPVAALRLPASMVLELRTLGLDRIADLQRQPRAPLTLRFGAELLRRLDRATGLRADPIEPVRPAQLVEVQQALLEPIATAEAIQQVLVELMPRFCAALEERGLGARRVDLVCHRVDDRAQALRIGTSTPVRDPKRLLRLLQERIETIEPGFGIELMSLAATLADPLAARQATTSLVDAAVPDISDLVDALANRVGAQRVYRVEPVESDFPERSQRRIPALSPATGRTWSGAWPRPPRLLARPEPVETLALLPDHPPTWFSWRGVRRRVRRADGPERVFGEWWRCDAELAAVRDYFRVEDEAGQRYWLFRAGDGEDPGTGSHRWYLHGLFG